MAGYTRTDTSNNIADGKVIDAADFDAEYDAIEAAFDETSGHTHDGTAAEGAPIEVTGPAQEYLFDGTAIYPKTDDTYDLGKTGAEFKDLWIDGVANVDQLRVGVNTLTTITDIALTASGIISSEDTLNFGVEGTGTIRFYSDVDDVLTGIAGATLIASIGPTGLTTAGAVITGALDISGISNASAVRGALGLGLGVDVQVYDAGLKSIADLVPTADQMLYATGSNVYATTSLTAAGRALLDDASASAQRTTLGLGTMATQNATSVNIDGGTINGITDLAIVDGGTGASNASGARTNLGLGTMATQNATSVNIDGGTVNNITSFTVGTATTAQGSVATIKGTMNGGAAVQSGSAAGLMLEDENGNQGFLSISDTGSLSIGTMEAGAEVFAHDGNGNITTISPHSPRGWEIVGGASESMAWNYYSQRTENGELKEIAVDMLKALRVLEALSGEKLVYEV